MDLLIDYLYTLSESDLDLLCRYHAAKDPRNLAEILYTTFDMPSAEKLWEQYGTDLVARFQNDHSAPKDVTALPEEFFRNDPSPGKKAVEWLITSYLNGSIHLFEDLSRARVAIADYYYLLGKGAINKYMQRLQLFCGLQGCTVNGKIMPGLESYLLDPKLQELLEARDEKKGIRKKYHVEPGEYEVVYEDNLIRVTHPLSENAACTLGAGTTWCTAATKSDNMFSDYNAKGPVYIITPKTARIVSGRDEKYQFHPNSNQLMDASNKPVDIQIFDEYYGNVILNIPLLREDYILYYLRRTLPGNERRDFLLKLLSPEKAKTLLLYKFIDHSFTPAEYIAFISDLINDGADLNARDSKGRNSLYYALTNNRNDIPIIDYLIKFGADINNIDFDGRNILSYFNFRSKELFNYMIKLGADIHIIDNNGNNLFYYIPKHPSSEIVNYLLNNGVDPNTRNKDGSTLLFSIFDTNVNEEILKKGVDPTIVNKYGDTALHIQVSYNDDTYANVKLLLAYGADPNIPNNNGKTPIDLFNDSYFASDKEEIYNLFIKNNMNK